MVVTPKTKGSKKNKKIRKIITKKEVIESPLPKIPEQQIATARNFYNSGFSANLAYQQNGMPGHESCKKLWRFWDGQRRDEYEMDTNERQINQKQRMNDSFERILLKLEIKQAKYETTMQSEYNEWQGIARKAESDGTVPPLFEINSKLEMDHLKIMELILETRDAMTALAFTPTINEYDEAAILKRMQEKADKVTKD